MPESVLRYVPLFFFQSVADMVQSYGLFVMFHRIWCTSNAIAPPVIDGTSIHRCILHFIPDLVIQFLKRHHMHGDFFAIFSLNSATVSAMAGLIGALSEKRRKHWWYRNRTDNRFLYIPLCSQPDSCADFPEVLSHHHSFAEVIFCHKVNIFIQDDAEGISQVIMLTIPYQQTLSVLISQKYGFWFWYSGYMPWWVWILVYKILLRFRSGHRAVPWRYH